MINNSVIPISLQKMKDNIVRDKLIRWMNGLLLPAIGILLFIGFWAATFSHYGGEFSVCE